MSDHSAGVLEHRTAAPANPSTRAAAAAGLAEMDPRAAAAALAAMRPEEASAVLGEMRPDDRVDVLAHLAPPLYQELVGGMGAQDADEVRRLERYAPDTAGGIMTTDVTALP